LYDKIFFILIVNILVCSDIPEEPFDLRFFNDDDIVVL